MGQPKDKDTWPLALPRPSSSSSDQVPDPYRSSAWEFVPSGGIPRACTASMNKGLGIESDLSYHPPKSEE